MALARTVIEEDHRLAEEVESAAEALGYHRWHWTLDEQNPNRVTIAAYARAVGRSHTTIAKHAKGYAAWRENREGVPLYEAIDRAQVSVEKQAAIDAVAAATGGTYTSAKAAAQEYRAVMDEARARAEARGRVYEEEVVKVAEQRHQARERSRIRSEEQRGDPQLLYHAVEADLTAAKRRLQSAFHALRSGEIDEQQRVTLADAVQELRRVVNLVAQNIAASDEHRDGDLSHIAAASLPAALM